MKIEMSDCYGIIHMVNEAPWRINTSDQLTLYQSKKSAENALKALTDGDRKQSAIIKMFSLEIDGDELRMAKLKS